MPVVRKEDQKLIINVHQADEKGWTDYDYHWLNYYNQRKSEGFPPKNPLYASGKASCEAIVRAQSPKAWAKICKDQEAEECARHYKAREIS